MSNKRSSYFMSAAKPFSFTQWFACLSEALLHPLLHDEEKLLWLWLATQCAHDLSYTCSFNYEDISLAVNKPIRKVHRILARLRVMGALIANLPIYYGEPTPEMAKTVYTIKIVLPPKPLSEEEKNQRIVPYIPQRKSIALNLIKKRKI